MGTRHSLHRLKPLILSREMKPGRYGDGGGLGLVIYRNGSRSWYFRYMLRGKAVLPSALKTDNLVGV